MEKGTCWSTLCFCLDCVVYIVRKRGREEERKRGRDEERMTFRKTHIQRFQYQILTGLTRFASKIIMIIKYSLTDEAYKL